MKKSIAQHILIEVGRLITPFENLDSKEEVAKVLNEVGLEIEAKNLNINLAPLKAAIGEVKKVLKELDELEEEKGIINKIKELAERLKPAIDKINEALPSIKAAVGEIQGLAADAKEILDEIPKRILDYFIYIYVEEFHPKLYAIAYVNGIAEAIVDKNSKKIRTLHWKRIPRFIGKPHKNFAEVYKWNENFESVKLLERLNDVLPNFSIAGDLYEQNEELSKELGFFEGGVEELRFPILQKGAYSDDEEEDTYGEISLNISPFPRVIEILVDVDEYRAIEEQGEPYDPEDFIDELEVGEYRILQKAGLYIYPQLEGQISLEQSDDISDTWNIKAEGQLKSELSFGLELRPEEKIQIRKNATLDANLKVVLSNQEEDEAYISLQGEPDGQGLFIGYKNFDIQTAIGGGLGTNLSIHLETNIRKFTFRIDGSKGDGFISKILENVKLESISDVGLGFSNDEGVYFVGSSGLQVNIPLHKQIGPVFIEEINISSSFGEQINWDLSTSFRVELGPFEAVVQNLGTNTSFKFPDNLDGNLGPVDAQGFRIIAPNSIGLKIKSPIISGGGFLENDSANHRYAGILSLNMKAIELTAIGLITTKLPNNRKGFSMLVSISVFFNPPIQLSFGFTLNAVGGLIGVNRTMKVDVLRERMISGSMDSVMFPSDPIKNAARIIGDLRAIFPPQNKHYVIAPFLRIAWGGKSLIEVDLGVLVELPFKGRVILLGSVGMHLPVKENPLTKIRIDVLGDFNFAEEYIRLEGRLRDSHIVGIPLSGGFAFVLSWDKRPQFLFSVGGYHPRYKKPARFPAIPRLSAILKKKKGKVDISLTCEYYTAITSNSFQIGFKADLYAKYKKASIHGYFAFNALLQFNPFYFEADINMGVSVKYKKKKLAGVDLYFLLSGPKPWTVKGRAKIKVAFIKFKIKFHISWGGKQKALPQSIGADVLLTQLREELEQASNWAAKLPARFTSAELLRSIEENPSTLVIHPSGYLEVRQTAVPLNRTIEKYGNSFVEGRPRYMVDVKLNNETLSQNNPLKEYFARGQYEDLTDAEKISAKDFELYDAGYSFASISDFDFGEDELISINSSYEETIIDEELVTIKEESERVWDNFSARNTKRTRQFRAQAEQAFRGLGTPILYQEEEQYYVVDKEGNVLLEEASNCIFDTEAEAKLHIRAHFYETSSNYQIMTIEEYTSEFEPA